MCQRGEEIQLSGTVLHRLPAQNSLSIAKNVQKFDTTTDRDK